jgi:hypothetical protein
MIEKLGLLAETPLFLDSSMQSCRQKPSGSIEFDFDKCNLHFQKTQAHQTQNIQNLKHASNANR